MRYKFNVPDMTCSHCRARIEGVLNDTGKVGNISTDLDMKTVELESDLPEEELIQLFDEAGYDAVII